MHQMIYARNFCSTNIGVDVWLMVAIAIYTDTCWRWLISYGWPFLCGQRFLNVRSLL